MTAANGPEGRGPIVPINTGGSSNMENALEYDAIASGVFAPLYPVVAEAILERTGVLSGRMLDVGCGGGHLGFAVMERAPFEGWLVDVSPDAVELCRERSLGLGLGDRCRCLVGDVHALPLKDAFFDLVVSRGSMGFWRDYPLAFGEIRRVLKPGGRAYVGGGLGNRETFERIRARMRELEPDWPANVKKRQRSVSTVELRGIIERTGLGCRVVENEDEGRWFVLSRPGA